MLTELYDPKLNIFRWSLFKQDELFQKLKNVPQNQIWHKEGDVYTHTCYVIQEMIDELDNVTMYDLKEILLYSALLHDVGKIDTTVQDEQGIYHSPGHAECSVKYAKDWIDKYKFPEYVTDAVCGIIRNHMRIAHVSTIKDLRKIIHSLPYIPFSMLLLFKKCDYNGAIFNNPHWKTKLEETEKMFYENFSYPAGTRVRVTKIEDSKFNGNHPNNIQTGTSYEGPLFMEVTVGCGVFVGRSFHTSSVTEIIDKNHFKTLNSIYKITEI